MGMHSSTVNPKTDTFLQCDPDVIQFLFVLEITGESLHTKL